MHQESAVSIVQHLTGIQGNNLDAGLGLSKNGIRKDRVNVIPKNADRVRLLARRKKRSTTSEEHYADEKQ